MILFKGAQKLKEYIRRQKQSGKTVGFVPTMGALHQGHLSLITLCTAKADVTVCSIFINPTQFNDPKDFEKYPVTTGNDVYLLERSGCDVVFLPALNEIYPEGFDEAKHYNLGELENVLEGKYRPGHFQGVCRVMDKLLHITMPDLLFLGQKDYQQCLVIKRLIELLGMPVTVVTGDTQREPNGLAMSSRNMRLTHEQRQQAAAIYSTLSHIKASFKNTDLNKLKEFATNHLLANGFSKVDYVAIADTGTLQAVSGDADTKAVALIAAFIGDVRLIDNMLL